MLRNFTDQLDEVRLLKKRLMSLNECDPFDSSKASNLYPVDSSQKAKRFGSEDEHLRMLRLGYDMIENLFRQMHDLIDKAKA